MTSSWQPLSARVGSRVWDDSLQEGVPEHLETTLREWIKQAIWSSEFAIRVMARLRIPRKPNVTAIAALTAQEPDSLLDIADCILKILSASPPSTFNANVSKLDQLLLDSGSAYRVAPSRDGLERRVDPTATSGFNNTVQTASANANSGSAADHLQKAWKAVYGLHPDPSQGYAEAIKAVESAAQSIVQPNNPKATLGTMIPEMRQAAHKITSAISAPGGVGRSDAAPFADLMDQLWKGQTSRHGSQVATRTETQEEAEAAVHIAILLVYMFASGAIIRQP